MYLHNLKEDLHYNIKLFQLTKFNNINTYTFDSIKKVILSSNFSLSTNNKRNIMYSLLFFRFLAKKKPIFIRNSKDNPERNIKKNTIIGCKTTLRRQAVFGFLDKTLANDNYTDNRLQISKANLLKNKSNFILIIKNPSYFSSIYSEYFQPIENIQIDIAFSSNKKDEHIFLINAFKLGNINYFFLKK